MQIIQLVSLLLDYPQPHLLDGKDDMLAIIANAPLTAAQQQAMTDFVQDRLSGDLMDWQSEYDGLFERGRSLSLLLFEHVHGESRDRGQAMVNLMNQYKEAGLDIGVKELPDYLPLYLEFLSTQGNENIAFGLQEVAPILALLACRLEQRDSNYAALFHALLSIANADIDLDDIKQQIAGEQRDDTPKALDKVWEEEMVNFMDNNQASSACGTANKPSEGQRRDQFVPVSTDLLFNEITKEAAAKKRA